MLSSKLKVSAIQAEVIRESFILGCCTHFRTQIPLGKYEALSFKIIYELNINVESALES